MAPQNETNIWKRAQLFVCGFGDQMSRVLRNQRYKGPIVAKGRITEGYADCGVGGDGGHDLIGWRSFIIRPEHVGKRIAQYLSIETKVVGGSKRKEQKMMVDIVKKSGGLSGFARDNDEVQKIMEDW